MAYNAQIADLLREPGLKGLAISSANSAVRGQLKAIADAGICAPQAVADRAMAAACRAGLWLYFDYFEESHQISQDLHTVEGSYWHAILHRREPDADNAKYWFRRVGSHAIFPTLATAAAELATNGPKETAFLASQRSWDAFGFVDLCESARTGQADCTELCLAVQRREWELLFEYCHQRAVGAKQ